MTKSALPVDHSETTVPVKVLRDFVLLKPLKDEEEVYGTLTVVKHDNRLPKGLVVAKGSGVLAPNLEKYPVEVNVGDTVVYDKLSARSIRHLGEEYIVVNELSVVCVLLNETPASHRDKLRMD